MPFHSDLVIRFVKIWETFVEVAWMRELFDGSAPMRYHLIATADDYKVERYFSKGETQYRLVGLQPGSEVKVSVRGQIEEGEWGSWASRSATLHPCCSMRVGKVGRDFIHGVFTWGTDKEDTPTQVYARVARFQLRVQQKERVLASSVCDQELPPQQREFRIDGLDTDTTFLVQVRAISQYGDVGHWSEETRFVTLREVVMRIKEVGEDYAVAWWGRQGDENGTWLPSRGSRSSIEQLTVRLKLRLDERERLVEGTTEPRVVDEQTFGGDVCLYKMRNLIPGRVYELWKRELNIMGDWSDWTCCTFRTVDRVGMVDVLAVSHNFLHISWDQEHCEGCDLGPLPVDVSIVNWQVRCINTTTNEESTVVLPEHERSTRIINLPHSTELAISVRAKTGFGEWGPWSEERYVATLPPLTVHVSAVGENWVNLSWARAEKKHDDSIMRYHLQLSAADTPFRLSKYFPPDVTEHRFGDLQPNTEYKAAVQACIGDRWQPWSECTSVHTTSATEVKLVRRGEDFVQISWKSDYYTANNIDPLDQRFELKVVQYPDEHVAGTGCAEQVVVHQEMTNVFGYRIARLPPACRVTVRARAYDILYDRWGFWCEAQTYTTLPSVLTYTMIGETCFEVAWQKRPRIVSAVPDSVPVAQDPLHPDDAVMYILRVNEIDADGSALQLQKYHFTDKDKPFFVVEGLKPNSVYSAQMCTADAEQTWSPWSAPAMVTTVPSLVLTVVDMGEDYCSLRWAREPRVGGGEVPMDPDTRYRISATPLRGGGEGNDDEQLIFTVEGESEYTIRHLAPSTSYRVSICAYPKQTNIWGVWSDPVYIRSNDPIEVDMDAVGEDHVHISWRRVEPKISIRDLHPECQIVRLGPGSHSKQPQEMASSSKVLHLADSTITEFNIKVYRINEDEVPPHGGEPKKVLEYERFLPFSHTALRIPQLSPNTRYAVVACACNHGGEWGVWSNALHFRTTMPTEIVISEITQECIRVKWGRGAASDTTEATVYDKDAPQVSKYQLKITGPDDDLCREVILPSTQMEYEVSGLSINCCYAISVRAHLQGDDDWGQWCNSIFVALRAVKVGLVEASQDWLKLNWMEKSISDVKNKQMFITLVGDGRATTHTLPPGCGNEYVFSNLNPLSIYSVHLLCVEQVASYVRCGGAMQSGVTGVGMPPVLPDNGRPTDTGIVVALPLVAADYSSFYTDSCAFSTLANIAMEVVKVGENFVTVKWGREVHAHGAAEAAREREAEYEVNCVAVGDVPAAASPGIRTIRGTEITLSGLAFNTLYELRVRKVSFLKTAWSKAVTVQTLDRVRVQVGPTGIAADDTEDAQVGVGEDFILLNWEKSLGAQATQQQTSFIVRCAKLSASGDEESVNEYQTTAHQFKLGNLNTDTKYKLAVRSVIDDEGELRPGEWCDDVVLSTLAPMEIRTVGITEESASVEWFRRGENTEVPRTVHTIASYHLKVLALPVARKKKRPSSAGSDTGEEVEEAATVLVERQLLEEDNEFGTRKLLLTGLKPGHTYMAMIRASTENCWGAWSDGVTFTTQPLLTLDVFLAGEETLFLSWAREKRRASTRPIDTSQSVRLAEVEGYELAVSTVGRDRTHFSKRLPPTPNRHRLDGLTPNSQYSVCLRPCYSGGGFGSWSQQVYACTLAPIQVQVSRIGETFVYVKWNRAQQQRITGRLREQHKQQQEEFEAQQLELQGEIDSLKLQLNAGLEEDDGGLFEKEFLEKQEEAPAASRDSEKAGIASKLESLLQVQRQQQNRQRQLTKLQELQLLELERETVYPNGENIRYEVVITGTSSQPTGPNIDDGDSSATGTDKGQDEGDRARGTGDKSYPFTFRRRINCTDGVDTTSCKMDGLLPHSHYTVTVRAMYSNHASLAGLVDETELFAGRALLSTEQREKELREAQEQLLWGGWSAKAELTTLKQISLCMRGVGSTHCVVDWDTGTARGDAVTAICQYQLMVAERDAKKGGKGGRPVKEIMLNSPSLSSWTVQDLQPNQQYTVTVRVCYDDDRWGLWSNAITFLTLPSLSARVTAVAETKVSILVWREAQTSKDPQLLVWRPPQSELQLSINDIPSPSTFKLDLDTSTLLTLDDLTIDSFYTVRAREVDANGDWREWRQVVEFETLPAAPSKPQLDERRGRTISLSWQQRRNREGVRYLYKVEMAYTAAVQKGKQFTGEHGPFQAVGLLSEPFLRLDLTEPVHRCLFRVNACKEHQRLEGNSDSEDPYLWSQFSPVAHFHTPSVPNPPTQLKIINLSDTSATVKWKRPANWGSHANLLYKVYLSSSYDEKPVCLGSTSKLSFRMDDLVANTHYRVGVTAESAMGVSQNNHVLHFSTRVLTTEGPKRGGNNNPTSSTLPPRSSLRLPDPAVLQDERAGGSPRSVSPSAYSPRSTRTMDMAEGSLPPSNRYSVTNLAMRKRLPQRLSPVGSEHTTPQKGSIAAEAPSADQQNQHGEGKADQWRQSTPPAQFLPPVKGAPPTHVDATAI